MINSRKTLGSFVAGALIALTTIFGIAPAHAQIDVSYLQTCLKEEGSSLDVLVLMDSSRSLRDAKPEEASARKVDKGSDPEAKRGKILTSSLKILRSLAEESDRKFNISLRNFGDNSDPKELVALKERWVEWTGATSDQDLAKFVQNAVYADSPGTQWANGLISAKDQFKKKIGEATLAGVNSCSIMFWITDGAPTDSTDPICSPNGNASINWFRENNILVLGGLLKPLEPSEAEKASQFGPLVRGETCGKNEPGWTKGEVIEANDISDLAWGFVGLIASIKNLINLNGNGSSFNVDPSTSHIEIYTRKAASNWEIKKPDGTVFCSASNPGSRCIVKNDSEVGIVTVTVLPDKPIEAAGVWTISPGINSEDFLVYGGLSTANEKSRSTKPNLVISQFSPEAEEGKEAKFLASLVNPDGSAFSTKGFKSITICAKVESSKVDSCESGKTSANLTVKPTTTDKSVSFEAVLVSEKDPSREYRISATAKINVIPSGFFPSLVCEKEPCVLSNLANKNSKATSNLIIKAPTSGGQGGSVTLLGYTILADQIEGRGDGRFKFEVQKSNGEVVDWNDQGQSLNAGDKLTLTVSTDLGGSSEIQGVIKYKVSANGQEIVRQLDFKFNVGDDRNWKVLIALMLLAYLITVGLPYAFLLWSARRRAVLTVADNEFAYLQQPVTISDNGKVNSSASNIENSISATLGTSHEGLRFAAVEAGARSISIGGVLVQVIPPKWNPFVEPETRVSVEGSHLMSTYGGSEFYPDEAFFSRSLTNEAVVYFATESNLAPVTQEQSTSIESSSSALFAPSTSEVTEAVLIKKSGDVSATVTYFVPRYGNRAKSMADVNMKLKNTFDGANLAEHLSALRETSLENELSKIEELKKANIAKVEKSSKKASKEAKVTTEQATDEAKEPGSFSYFEDRIDNSEKSFFSDDSNDSDPKSDKKFWD